MINITLSKDCCGCEACSQICPKQCISLKRDTEGFLYPKVDTTVCIECGLCEKVCPIINQFEEKRPSAVYAAKNNDELERLSSSSGGIFILVAKQVISEGGVVFGVKFDENWNVVHDYCETIEELSKFQGSKYVQSRIGDSYKTVEKFLKNGRKVLFTGTSCQVTGLKHYLRKEYDNLFTIDVVCHGVPSPMVWDNYLNDIKRAKRSIGKNSVSLSLNETSFILTDVSFRDKTNGWKKYGFKITYVACKATENTVSKSPINPQEISLIEPFCDNIYMKGFLMDLYLRPSCYYCQAKAGKAHSDITIADYWGIQNYYPQFDDDKGVGLILINSSKGDKMYNSLHLNSIQTTYEEGFSANPVIEHSVSVPKYRSLFWVLYPKIGLDAVDIIIDKMKPSLFRRGLSFAKRCLKRLIRR